MKKLILVVEDEAAIAEGIEARLAVEGYRVATASDGQAAIAKAREDRPDLVLLDIMLPKINGWEVCKILRNDPHMREIPIIMLTALSQIRDSERAFEAGANDYLTKPFDAERLMAKVRRFLSGS